MNSAQSVVWLSQLCLDDIDNVGSEFAKLGELSSRNVQILDAVIVTPHANRSFQIDNNLDAKIEHIRQSINPQRYDSVTQGRRMVEMLYRRSEVPRSLYQEVFLRILERSYESVTIEAYFYYDNELLERKMIVSTSSDIEILDSIKWLWAHRFDWDFYGSKFSTEIECDKITVVLAIRPSIIAKFSGHAVIGAHKFLGHDRLVFDNLEEAELLDNDKHYIKSLIERCRNILGGGYDVHFAKAGEDILVTTIAEGSFENKHLHRKGYEVDGKVVNHGIVIGRIRYVSRLSEKLKIAHDEIIVLDAFQASMLKKISSAKGLIIRNPVDSESQFLLNRLGMPIVVEQTFFVEGFENGDYVKLDTPRKKITRGGFN